MEGLLSMGPTPSSFFYRLLELVGGGSVINGATLTSFFCLLVCTVYSMTKREAGI